MSVTLDQAEQASEQVDLCNSEMNVINNQIASIQASINFFNTFNLQNANDQIVALQAALTTQQNLLMSSTATIQQYNASNPGSSISIG